MLKIAILAVLQGLTEFLPISSSGHLVLVQNLLEIGEDGVILDIFLHLGTLLAICVVFFRDIIRLFTDRRRWIPLIVLASVPAVTAGFFFADLLEGLVEMPALVSGMLIVNGAILMAGVLVSNRKKSEKKIGPAAVFVVGMAQALALLPGISRSGSTISMGISLGWSRETAAKFSFLMSIPVIFGAVLYKLMKSPGAIDTSLSSQLALAVVISAFVGYFALKLLLNLLYRGKLIYFSYYCIVIGIIFLLIHLLK